jgi:serine/threonine-protein kinase OSR1/STK39
MEQLHGYDYKADLWSLGITALELAKGYAPYANFAPMQVLIRTIQEDPPSLDTYERFESSQDDIYPQEWSPRFRELVSFLLQKNPADRPTCQEVLHQVTWWSSAVSAFELANDICAHIPSIGIDYSDNHENIEDASMIWNTSSVLSSTSLSPTDRAPGTTWVFSDDDRTLLPIDSEDGLRELDEFCSAIGGEHYQKDEMENSDYHRESQAPSISWMEEYNLEKISDTPVDDDGLDEFLDEFEKTTSGENFQRRPH